MPGHFGTISSGLKAWIDRLGYLWAEGELIDKVGAVFCTTATTHGGLEMTMHNLITPMFHQGMIVVGLPATFLKTRCTALTTARASHARLTAMC